MISIPEGSTLHTADDSLVSLDAIILTLNYAKSITAFPEVRGACSSASDLLQTLNAKGSDAASNDISQAVTAAIIVIVKECKQVELAGFPLETYEQAYIRILVSAIDALQRHYQRNSNNPGIVAATPELDRLCGTLATHIAVFMKLPINLPFFRQVITHWENGLALRNVLQQELNASFGNQYSPRDLIAAAIPPGGWAFHADNEPRSFNIYNSTVTAQNFNGVAQGRQVNNNGVPQQ